MPSSNEIAKLAWDELMQAPKSAGVYAWYYEPEITDADLGVALANLTDLVAKGNVSAAEDVVRRLLTQLMRHFCQDPYEVTMVGALKPRYLGTVVHEQRLSPELIQRIVANPGRLRHLRDVLAKSAPFFASPLYIGMSENLRKRLKKHRALIEKFRALIGVSDAEAGDVESEEAGFARRVVQRKIPPTRLFVVVCSTPAAADLHVDAENLLNRMYYPILGRN